MKRGGLAILVAAVLGGCGFNQDDPYLSGEVRSLAEAPPPIHGGTLLATRDGRYAVAADPDRHRVLVVDLEHHLVRELALERGLELGRLVEDGAGRVYVVARRGGALIAIDPPSATVIARHEVCAAPRGVAWEAASDRLHVACADGTLVSLGPDRRVERRLHVAPDLRDVVVTEEGLIATGFRSARVYVVEPTGAVRLAEPLPTATLTSPPSPELSQQYAPNTAVRAAVTPDGQVVVLHQRARVGVEAVFRDVRVVEETTRRRTGYSYSSRPVSTVAVTTRTTVTGPVITWEDPCGNAVTHATLSVLDASGRPHNVGLPFRRSVTPVDVAVSAGGRVAVAFAGDPGGRFTTGTQVLAASLHSVSASGDGRSCLPGDEQRGYPAQVISVAFAGERLLVQTRSPSQLVIDRGTVIDLGGDDVIDTGHDLFHLDLGGTISCATCHPAGGDDGHVWNFSVTGPIRTQPLEGVVGRAPYHRSGDVASFSQLMDDLTSQMDGPALSADMVRATERWLTALPLPPAGPRLEDGSFERGRELFDALGCASCHAGELGTDRQLAAVRTDRTLVTPSLAGVALRAPYLHDGRAHDLSTALGWHAHDHLTGEQRSDLIRYLEGR